MSDDRARELQGVAGWLGLLVCILGIISPARMLFQAKQNIAETAIMGQVLGPNTSAYINFSWALIAISAAGSIFLSYRLLAIHRWSSVRIVIAGLWFLAVIPTAIDTAVGAALFPKFADAMIPEALWSIGRSSVSAFIWTTYLMASKRVANTYVKDSSETRQIFS